jgi:hypothetical protein
MLSALFHDYRTFLIGYSTVKPVLHKESDIFMKCQASENIIPYDLSYFYNGVYSRVSALEKDANSVKQK